MDSDEGRCQAWDSSMVEQRAFHTRVAGSTPAPHKGATPLSPLRRTQPGWREAGGLMGRWLTASEAQQRLPVFLLAAYWGSLAMDTSG